MQQSKRFLMTILISLIGCGTEKPSSTGAAGSQSTESKTVSTSVAADTESSGSNDTTVAQAKPSQKSDGSTSKNFGVQPDPTKPQTKSYPAPTAQQIAKWQIPDVQPLQLIACNDAFDDLFLQCLAVSPDGKKYVLGGSKLTVWNTADSMPTDDLISKYQEKDIERPIRSVAISPDGNWLAAGDHKGRLLIWNFSELKENPAIKAHDARLSQMAFSPDSQRLATTSYSGEVRIWQPDGKKLQTIKTGNREVVRMAFVTDTLLVVASDEVSLWDTESGTKKTTLSSGSLIGPALGVSSDRKWLAFADADAKTRLWDVEKSAGGSVSLLGPGSHLIAFSRDGKRIATHAADLTIRIWDASTGKIQQVIYADGGRTVGLHWLPESDALMVVTERGRVRFWGTAASAKAIGIEPMALPEIATLATDSHTPMSPAQLQKTIDVRSLTTLPGAIPQWADGGMNSYTASVTQIEANQFYRYLLGKAGWTENSATGPAQMGLVFRKEGCSLNVSLTPANVAGTGKDGDLEVSVVFAGNYDVRWLPKVSAIKSPSSFESFLYVTYRTKASLTDVEVALLKQYHDAGWTAYSRLAASSHEDPESRTITMIQKGSMLNALIGRPADAADELAVQVSVSLTNKSIPIPADSGWIEFDSSTELQLVANTKMDLKETADFYDKQMPLEGWISREAGRFFKDDKGWMPFIRDQQDVLIRLVSLPEGGTRIIVGDADRSSWQLQKTDTKDPKSSKPGVEVADLSLPKGAKDAKFDIDQKQISFELPDTTTQKVAEEFGKVMDSLEWKKEDSGVTSDEYVLATFKKSKAEIQIRIRAAGKKATAMISGDGLLWDKPLPSAPVRISYGTWLRRDRKNATLDRLNEFADEMKKIPVSSAKPK